MKEEELKTLKEITGFGGRLGMEKAYWEGELKAKVIKWINLRINQCKRCDLHENFICEEHLFWINKFNLTKEDLEMKEEELESIYQEMNPFKINMPEGSSSKKIQELILENWEKEI